MAVEISLNLVNTVLEHTIGPVIRHAGYAFRCAKKVTELKKQVENLRATSASLRNSVAEAKRRGDQIQPTVEKWLTDAEKAVQEAGELTEGGEEEAKKRCFAGWSPNLKNRYQLGKKAAKEALAIQDLENKGNFNATQISYRAPPRQIVSSSVHGFEDLPSRASIFQEVMDALSDANVNMIGVYGMPGAGKTTLAKEVHKQADEGNLFNVVVMATVSVKPDLQNIQNKIAAMLGLELEEKTVDVRAYRIRQRLLKEKKVLIILDDLWEKSELEKLGIPLTDEKNNLMGCKLLLTSRNRDLLRDMGAKKEFELKDLPIEEARTLFLTTVGDLKDPTLKSIAREVADKCAGLPLLLVTVASALKNKAFEIWKDALTRLSASKDEKKVFSALELSYDQLPDEEVKVFFLLFCLFEYTDIPILCLVKYSMGLGRLKDVKTVDEARNRVQKLIDDLRARCLLLDSEMDGHVKIHDAVQDFAGKIALRDQFAFTKDGDISEEFPRIDIKSHSIINLAGCDVFDFPKMMLRCPETVLFILYPKDPSFPIPDSSFEGITKLRALDFTEVHFSSLPLSLGSLTSLCTLCLEFCRLEDISVITQLKNLEILSLWGSQIVVLPRDMGRLTRLKLLDLTDCSELEFIPENVLSQLSMLEELLMGNSFVNWEIKRPDNQSNASLSELEHLSRLTNLEIHVPDAKKLPMRLFSKKLERYKIFIGDKWDWDGKYQTSRTLKLKLDTSIHSKHWVKTLLNDVEDLHLDEVKEIDNVLYDLDIEGFQRLKHLHVQNSGGIRHIMHSQRPVHLGAFPVLQSLILHNLVNLDKISLGNLMAGDLCELRIAIVKGCNRLKNLFPFSTVRRNLQQLREMEIMDCSDMEVLFADESEEEEGDDKNEVVEFTQLHSLKLGLPQLRSFCSKVQGSPASTSTSHSRQNQSVSDPLVMEIVPGSDTSFPIFNGKIVFPNLKELKLSSVTADKIWHSQFADQHSFCKLSSLTVEACRNLNYLFTLSTLKSLARLQKLEICDCKVMEAVIATQGKTIDKTPVPNLEFLKLKGLPKLSTFCIGGLVEFPCLKELWIEDCLELKSFISNPVAVNTGSNLALFDEKVAFPKLEELRIINMDGLKMIWHDELPESSFSKLKSLIIKHAEELLNIFPSNMPMSTFLNLENLELNGCALLEEVFNLQPRALTNSRTPGLAASLLRTLTIQNLQNLKHIWNTHSQERVFFNNLQVVDVFGCPNLKRVFPAFIATGLLQLENLVLKNCGFEEIIERDEGTKARFEFPKLTTLILYNLGKLKTLYPGTHISEWPMLKRLDVHACGNVEMFASENGCFHENSRGSRLGSPLKQPFFSVEKVIPNLEELTLTGKDAQMIRDSQFPANLFGKVRSLHLQRFDAKSASFLFTLLRRFHNLETLEIVNNWLEEMFSCEGPVSCENHRSTAVRIQHIRLYFLYNLKSVWKQDCQLEQMFKHIKTLEIWGCGSLISLGPSVSSLGNLSHLDVWKCEGLLNLITSSTAQYMRHLTKLRIRECDMVEEVVAGGEDGREDQITWDNLKSLELRCLASLTCFSCANHTFKFPYLEEVIVTQCPKMNAFSGGVSITPKLKRVKLAVGDAKECWKGDLNTTIKQLCAELVGLHGIERLKLSDFLELKETWHKEHFPANFLSDLRSLVVDERGQNCNAVPSYLLRSLDKLAELEVKNCDLVEKVFDLTLPNAADGQIGTLPKLNILQLTDLPSLKQLWKEEPEGVFHLRNLRVLKIHNRSTLAHLFTPITCLSLVRLRKLEVKNCPLIKEIITSGAASGETSGETVDNIMLRLLNSVSLECLPNLTSFYSGSGARSMSFLKNHRYHRVFKYILIHIFE